MHDVIFEQEIKDAAGELVVAIRFNALEQIDFSSIRMSKEFIVSF